MTFNLFKPEPLVGGFGANGDATVARKSWFRIARTIPWDRGRVSSDSGNVGSDSDEAMGYFRPEF